MKKYFGTDGIRGHLGKPPISADWVLKLGWSIGTVLGDSDKTERAKILIGKDTRVSGYILESALQAGIASAGVDCYLLGPMPTPAIAYLTRVLSAKAGIVISASHNPYDDNGIKIFSSLGDKLSDELELAIEAKMEEPLITVDSKFLGKAHRIREAQGRYIEYCKSTFPHEENLKGIKLVLDCANGATYRVAPAVFQELGAEVITLGVKPDGYNINDHCGSMDPKNLQERVLQENASLGIAFDGDGDRVLMCDNRGELVDGDELVFIIAKFAHQNQTLHGGVVGTLMSNFGLEEGLKELGIEFCRTSVGDRYILEMLHQKHWMLGGESSGHVICLDANTTGDGIIAALKVLAACKKTRKTLFDLKKDMIKYPQTLINVPVEPGKNVQEVLREAEVEGCQKRIEHQLQGRGRVLLRPSGTEPVIRVMVEGRDPLVVETMAKELAFVISRSLKT